MLTPGGTARFVFTLAGGRVTPELERWIMDELPLCRAFQYWHCHWAAVPHVWTVAPGEVARVDEKIDRILASFDADAEEEGNLF
ncbi:MAG: hypothetical protein QM496_01920 [Verrucomicrobiota bacterium]